MHGSADMSFTNIFRLHERMEKRKLNNKKASDIFSRLQTEQPVMQEAKQQTRFIEAYTVIGNLGKTDTHGFLRSHLNSD